MPIPRRSLAKADRTSPTGFANSLKISCLASEDELWVTSPSLVESDLPFNADSFCAVSTHLLANPNLLSPNLFRADILHDSLGLLQTPEDTASNQLPTNASSSFPNPKPNLDPNLDTNNWEAKNGCRQPSFPNLETNLELKRSVVRKLIPRKPQVDSPCEQTCFFYEASSQHSHVLLETRGTMSLAAYYPHVTLESDIPFYHPAVRAYALLYEHNGLPSNDGQGTPGTLSLHFIPFDSTIPSIVSNRLHRSLLSLLSIHIRLARSQSKGIKPKPLKDNVIPQHIVQNTYSRLKTKYAASLVEKWVEHTEPSKHVFEDISIAAFLIELWKKIYSPPTISDDGHDDTGSHRKNKSFPGFVDIACGNGVLVFILLSEGYNGWGFDARQRKTWSIFPPEIQERLKERICIPAPFQDTYSNEEDLGAQTISGLFEKGTFIISNHADELTVWTPLLGYLSNPSHPLPFLAIPCCSHSLSGTRYRYPPPKDTSLFENTSTEDRDQVENIDSQPTSGDLRALRGKKLDSQNNPGSFSSTYGCLTAKVVSIAEELGYNVEKTLLRIPSTRNIGVIGWLHGNEPESSTSRQKEITPVIIDRETMRDGGVISAAKLWTKRSTEIRTGPGRGKLNEHHG
ncbi:tRNA(Ser) Um(44) 2'-O-methyltransferase [Myotisia sp. PD_48]|nr:tRNA(Ser) Um(44) 2'-O-methyltransferase [Myotisia sp. PD_48]